MYLPFSLFLAFKYLRPKRTFISVISLISVTGVILGVAVLVIVIAVMSGFDEMWRRKILGFDAHITVTSAHGVIEDEQRMMAEVARVPGVAGVAPYIQGLVFIQHGEQVHTPVLLGVDPRLEAQVSLVSHSMVEGEFDLGYDGMVIGRELARRLGARLGDRLLLYSPYNFTHGADVLSLPEELEIRGIFEIGMWEYDVGFAMVPLGVAREMYGLEQGVHALRVMTHDPFRAAVVAGEIDRQLARDFPEAGSRTWMQMNRQLFNALKVEKNMMFFLLIFIVLVAAFGLTNTLIVEVVQKTKEIGLLKALGFTSGSIMRVFLWQGWIQGACGTILGIAMGILVLHFRNDIMRWLAVVMGVELFPKELYHLSEIPARVTFADLGLVAVLSMLICTLAGLVPAWRAARLDPARALRYE
ncbi:MAG: FtsX-like permease family protein [Kiritimatiellia bacterium]|nr:ABC transporter permease [Lentisphaerota bacterium]